MDIKYALYNGVLDLHTNVYFYLTKLGKINMYMSCTCIYSLLIYLGVCHDQYLSNFTFTMECYSRAVSEPVIGDTLSLTMECFAS